MTTKTDRTRGKYSTSAFLLPVVPVVFVLLTYLLFYFTLLPHVQPYLNLAGLFVSEAPQTAETRNLFTEPRPVAAVTVAQSTSGGGTGMSETAVTGIPVGEIIKPAHGDLYARLTIEGTNIDAPVYWNDSETELNAGVGTYTGGWLPGFGRTVMLAGHRTTDLKDLGSAQIGGTITVETHYETYTYEITDIAVHHMNDSSAYDFSRTDENIIIYTCYPFDLIGAAKDRYFVYGEYRSGMQVERPS